MPREPLARRKNRDAGRTAKLAADLLAITSKLRRGDDYFRVHQGASKGTQLDVKDTRGRAIATTSRQALAAYVARGWAMENDMEAGGDLYAITPQGWQAVEQAKLRESA